MSRISCSAFVRGLLSVVAGSSILLNGPVWAQPLPYTFTKITDTVTTPAAAGVQCVGMNELGTVAVHLSNQAVYRGRDAASFAASTSATIKASALGTAKSRKLVVNP